jgi:hypothetical protein
VEVARKRVWKRLLASPWVVVPLAVGIVATASLVISGSGAVVAATSFAVCSGVIAYRLAFGFDKINCESTVTFERRTFLPQLGS